MTADALLLAGLALMVGIVLAGGNGRPIARVLLFASALAVAGLLFLPGDQITGFLGDALVTEAKRVARLTPWTPSDWTHFVLFAWLGLLVWVGRVDLRGWKALVLLALLGLASELLQGLAPERSPRVDDVLLNIAGGMLGLLLGMVFARSSRGASNGKAPR